MSKVRIHTGVASLFLAGAALAGCAKYRPPTIPSPEPGYRPVDAPAAAVWDGVVEFFVDTGLDFSFVNPDMRMARATVLVAPKAKFGDRSPLAGRYADCGQFGGVGVAGWNDLMADVTMRVKEGPNGKGLLKVVAWMRQETSSAPAARCVSRGRFEDSLLETIARWVKAGPSIRG